MASSSGGSIPGALVFTGCVVAFVSSAAFAACGDSESPTTTSGTGGDGGGSSSVTTSASSGSGGEGGGVGLCFSPATTVPKGECDMLRQDCGPGQTCRPATINGSWTTQCSSFTGLRGKGQACESNTECLAGLFCTDVCTPVCCRESNEPCGGGICNVEFTFSGAMRANMCAFSKQCDLLHPDACPEGYDCHMQDPTQGLATCIQPSGGVVGELQPCTYINDCASMQECFSSGSGAKCHWYCKLGTTGGTPGLGGCPAGETCLSVVDGTAVDFGVPGIGLCAP
jgi:hypothetical protein